MAEDSILVGTSNVNRLYDPDMFDSKSETYNMKKCCNKEVFAVMLSQVNTNNKRVIMCFDNKKV